MDFGEISKVESTGFVDWLCVKECGIFESKVQRLNPRFLIEVEQVWGEI